MAIYNYDDTSARLVDSFHQLTATASQSYLHPDFAKIRALIERREYQAACDSLGGKVSGPLLANIKAVLLLRLGKAESATSLLRSFVWDLSSFVMRTDTPGLMRLNFATGLLLSGHVAGCLEVLRSIKEPHNEQASELLAEIRSWEKSLSMIRRLDWKLCGIEHIPTGFPFHGTPGRFGWEPNVSTVSNPDSLADLPNTPSHKLAC